MEKVVHEDEQPQPILNTTSPTPTNPPTPPKPTTSSPLVLTPDLPSPPSLLHLRKHETEDDDEYFDSFPPGYKFLPNDDELIVHYLRRKMDNLPLPRNRIIDVKLYEHNPQNLAEQYKHYGDRNGEKKWYFFTPRDRKYKNGVRPNRAAGDGYWKATGADKAVRHKGHVVGYRKSLVFYVGKPPRGRKTNWIMHEFRVSDPPKPRIGSHDMKLDDWVLCRIHEKDERPAAARNRQAEDSIYSMDEDGGENDNDDNNNNLMSPPPYDDHPLLLDSYDPGQFNYPIPSPSFNHVLNFCNNQLVEDGNNQLESVHLNFGNFGSYGNLLMPNNHVKPWRYNPVPENQFPRYVHDEVLYGGKFDEIDPSSLMSLSVPGVPTLPTENFDNHSFQPLKIAESFDNPPPVQPVKIPERFDNPPVPSAKSQK